MAQLAANQNALFWVNYFIGLVTGQSEYYCILVISLAQLAANQNALFWVNYFIGLATGQSECLVRLRLLQEHALVRNLLIVTIVTTYFCEQVVWKCILDHALVRNFFIVTIDTNHFCENVVWKCIEDHALARNLFF